MIFATNVVNCVRKVTPEDREGTVYNIRQESAM